MCEYIYDLVGNNENSNKFYDDLSVFTNDILRTVDISLWNYVKGFSDYTNVDFESNKSVLYLEALSLGVYWNRYITNAMSVKKGTLKRIIKIVELRKYKSFKSTVDKYRSKINSNHLLSYEFFEIADFNIFNFERLLLWLRACGEHPEFSLIANKWYRYLGSINKEDCNKIIEKFSLEARRFKSTGKNELGIYTRNVNKTVGLRNKELQNTEHIIFCSKTEVEYHLNFFGAEVLNRFYEKEFMDTSEKYVFLPSCMSEKGDKCQSKVEDYRSKCVDCSDSCGFKSIKDLLSKKGINTFMIQHSTEDIKLKSKPIGMIGVACSLNLLEGGYKAARLGFIPQCIILDYPGCKKHWHESGLSTKLNIEKLIKILSN